jgi:hypothetical protein
VLRDAIYVWPAGNPDGVDDAKISAVVVASVVVVTSVVVASVVVVTSVVVVPVDVVSVEEYITSSRYYYHVK